MRRLVLFTLIGFFAQLVDGSLGMAYGATSASLLLFIGVAPAVASASIHMAEIATTAASGASHIWFKNVERRVVIWLIIPGSVSAFVGAAFLSQLPGDAVKPFISIFLLILGVVILVRFLRVERVQSNGEMPRLSGKLLIPLGVTGGFFDAVGGGGWGPITTPVLLSRKGASPRKVIGTVDTSEFAIAVSATLGFVIFLGWEQFQWTWVLAFMIGGVLAAPLAAYLVKVIPSYLLGVLVGGFIIVTNAGTLFRSIDVLPSVWAHIANLLLVILWVGSVVYQVRMHRRNNAATQV
jgi:uncharacterized membrane protein YfcA